MFDATGWSVIFPIIGMACMLLMMSRMLRLGSRGPRRGTGTDPMPMGPMGPMGITGGEQDREGDNGALDVLRRRYAAGELTDDEFDAMRDKLGGRLP